MACGVELNVSRALDPSEAETVVAPTLSPTPESGRAASLGPSGPLPGMSTKGQGVDLGPRGGLDDDPPPPPPPPPAADPVAPPPDALATEPVSAELPSVDPEVAEAPTPSTPQPAIAAEGPTYSEPPPAEPAAEPIPEPAPGPVDPASLEADGMVATGMTDQWMALGEQSPPTDLTAGVEPPADAAQPDADPAVYDDGAGYQAGDLGGAGEEDMSNGEEKKSKTGLYIGIGVGGCLLLLCCIGIAAGIGVGVMQAQNQSSWEDYDWSGDTTDWSNWESTSWGKVKITTDTANVYSSADASSSVAESKSKGDTLDYYGFDDNFEFYKVKTASGSDGFVKLLEAEIAFE